MKIVYSTIAFSLVFTAAFAAVPPRKVSLQCEPLSYGLHCAIGAAANPEVNSNCWLIMADGSSQWMRTDRRFNFYTDQVHVHLRNGRQVTADITDHVSGETSTCK